MNRKISQNGIDFIKSCEGFRSDAYADAGGVWTVGYGTTRFVTPTAHVTPEEAEGLLRKELSHVEEILNTKVKVPLNQNQFDALCSFVYNVGIDAFMCSHLRADLNGGHYLEAADQFLRWHYIHGVENAGLLTRREKERKLFLEDVPS